MVGWFVIRNIVAGSKFVYKNEHRAPQNLKNFVGDFSEVRITTNLPAGIYAEGNPFPATKVSKLAHWGKFSFDFQYFRKVRKFCFEKLQNFDTFELVMI